MSMSNWALKVFEFEKMWHNQNCNVFNREEPSWKPHLKKPPIVLSSNWRYIIPQPSNGKVESTQRDDQEPEWLGWAIIYILFSYLTAFKFASYNIQSDNQLHILPVGEWLIVLFHSQHTSLQKQLKPFTFVAR